jgi:hypothetical protein
MSARCRIGSGAPHAMRAQLAGQVVNRATDRSISSRTIDRDRVNGDEHHGDVNLEKIPLQVKAGPCSPRAGDGERHPRTPTGEET